MRFDVDYKQTHIAVDHKHGRPLIACRFSPSGDVVYFAAEDFAVWGLTWQGDRKVKYDTQAWVRGLTTIDEGRQLVTGGYDGRLIWWPTDSDDPKPIRTIEAHVGWIRAIDVSPDGEVLASVGNDRAIRFWNSVDGTALGEIPGIDPGDIPIAELEKDRPKPKKDEEKKEGDTSDDDTSDKETAAIPIGHRTDIYNVQFHPNGQSLVTGDLMGQLIEWNLETRKPIRSWTADSLSKYDKGFRAQIGGFRSLQFQSDGTKLFASGITNVTNAFAGVGNPSVVEFHWADAKQAVEYLSKPKLQGVAWGVSIHKDGTVIASHGGSNGHLVFWKPGEAEAAHQFKLPQNGRDLDQHPDGQHLAVAGSNGHLWVALMGKKA